MIDESNILNTYANELENILNASGLEIYGLTHTQSDKQNQSWDQLEKYLRRFCHEGFGIRFVHTGFDDPAMHYLEIGVCSLTQGILLDELPRGFARRVPTFDRPSSRKKLDPPLREWPAAMKKIACDIGIIMVNRYRDSEGGC